MYLHKHPLVSEIESPEDKAARILRKRDYDLVLAEARAYNFYIPEFYTNKETAPTTNFLDQFFIDPDYLYTSGWLGSEFNLASLRRITGKADYNRIP